MTTTSAPVDWQRWLDRWEAQQGGYMHDREERFTVIVEAVAALCGEAPHVVDLGCGPGSLARRILDRLPGARVTAIDMDPVLLAIGRNALGDRGGRLEWVDADLRGAWRAEGIDAAVSTTALHWLQPDALGELYRRLASALQPGGIFVNGDRMDVAPTAPRITEAVLEIRERRPLEVPQGAESWKQWWTAVEQEPAFEALVSERGRRHHDHPDHDRPLDVATHAGMLREAGFTEVDTVWQHFADRVLVAVR